MQHFTQQEYSRQDTFNADIDACVYIVLFGVCLCSYVCAASVHLTESRL